MKQRCATKAELMSITLIIVESADSMRPSTLQTKLDSAVPTTSVNASSASEKSTEF
jgi:hypothetical protein